MYTVLYQVPDIGLACHD